MASIFTVGVSLESPPVPFAIQHTSLTWPKIAGVTLRLKMRIYSQFLVGDHDIIVLEAPAFGTSENAEGRVFHRSDFAGLAALIQFA